MTTLPNIEVLRKNFPREKCQIKYYPELDFLAIFDNIKKANKKKSVPLSAIKTPYHVVGFFLNNKLVRIDYVGAGVPKETYITWEDDVVKEAHEFYTGIGWGKKISNKAQVSASWFYTYENGLIKKIVWVHYEDRKYYDHGEMTVTYDYKYDDKGLLLTRKTVMGKGKLWKRPLTHIIYDREKELFLKTCTISKTALVAKRSPVTDTVIDFKAGRRFKTCNCSKCKKPLSFIVSVNMDVKRFNLTNINSKQLPVLTCFNCLKTQHYNPGSLNLEIKNKVPFTETDYKLVTATDKKTLAKAFLKVGGQPTWIQGDEHPKCRNCNKTMKFIVEIQTDESLSNGADTLAIGDSGKLYVFACCDNVTTIPQWY